MVFELIEQLKQQYTDKYVVVDASRPELARFKGQTGLVKTVNMSGRALVEFDAYANIGWYDIELDFLKVIDKPLAKEPEKEKRAEPTAKPAPAAKAPAAAAEKKPAGKSTADIVAAARAKTAAKPGTPAPAEAAKPAPASGEKKKLSVAEMMAAARAEKAAGAAKPHAATTAEPVPPTAQPEAKKPGTAAILAAARTKKSVDVTPAPATEPPPIATPEAPTAVATPDKSATGGLPTGTAERIAYCRRVDAK
jgi:hypothetical protein